MDNLENIDRDELLKSDETIILGKKELKDYVFFALNKLKYHDHLIIVSNPHNDEMLNSLLALLHCVGVRESERIQRKEQLDKGLGISIIVKIDKIGALQ